MPDTSGGACSILLSHSPKAKIDCSRPGDNSSVVLRSLGVVRGRAIACKFLEVAASRVRVDRLRAIAPNLRPGEEETLTFGGWQITGLRSPSLGKFGLVTQMVENASLSREGNVTEIVKCSSLKSFEESGILEAINKRKRKPDYDSHPGHRATSFGNGVSHR